MSCSQCYPFVIYRLIWRLLALLRPMQPALRTPRCRAQRTITIKNVTLRWCIAHCSSVPLSSTKYRAWSDIIVTGDTDWSACTYRAPSIVTLRYRDILIFYSNNFPSLNVVLIFLVPKHLGMLWRLKEAGVSVGVVYLLHAPSPLTLYILKIITNGEI